MKRKFYLYLLIIGFQFSYAQNEQFVPPSLGGGCCCGQFVELFYPNLDFEEAPSPPPGGLITYWLGDFFSGWTVTRASIDHKDAFFGNLTLGNPNGRSNFIDLHGSPGFGAIEYNLTGLTAGNTYRIDFWTAQNGSGYTSTGTLKIAGGAWFTGNWTVDTDGSVYWFKVTFMFVAKASTAKMEFSSIGGSEWGGTLLDDIKIFECPGDMEEPVVNNPPQDINVECDSEIPKIPILSIVDNCDLNPVTTFKVTTELLNPCSKLITRTWEIKDACGNIHTEEQLITIEDKTPPDFTKMPQDKFVYCSDDLLKIFNDWIKKNGDAIATDACGKVTWRTTIEHIPAKSCDSILVEFIAIDHCGQERSAFATFYVIDTVAPIILKSAENKSFYCNPNAKDSLRNWVNNHGFAEAKDACDTTIWSNNFNGDSTRKNIGVWFYAKDLCGNVDSTFASFVSRNSNDTFRVFLNSCTIPKSTIDTFVYPLKGCDSIVIVNATRIPSDTIRLQMNTCDLNQKKFDSIYLKNSFGCDSLIIQEFILRPIQFAILKDSSCAIVKLFKDTLLLKGQYCDSMVITEHHPLLSDSIFILNTSCDSTQKGTVIKQLKNVFGCDSIISITTDFSAQSVTFISSMECGILLAYKDTAIYSTKLCDSVVITNHVPLRRDSVFMQAHTCDPKQAGLLTLKLVNSLGCDSIVIVNRILDQSDSIHVNKFSCKSSDVGISNQKLQNHFGCDSLIVTETFLLPGDSTHVDKFSCLPNEVGRVRQVLQNQLGCDSIIVTETFLIPGDSIHIQAFTCKSNQAGTNRRVLKNMAGCDSTITTVTILLQTDTTYLAGTTCIYNQQRKDTIIYQTTTCDSLVIRDIVFIPSDTTVVSLNTCLKSEAGLDSMLLRNKRGCDSLIYVNKLFVPLKLKFQLDSITCFNKNDGLFKILNPKDFSLPYELILNNQTIANASTVSNLGSGNYSIFIRDKNGCITDTIFFSLVDPSELITNLGNDLEVAKGAKVELNLNSNRNLFVINWQPANLTNCSNCNKIDFIADNDIWIYTLALDDRNCESRDSIFIRVKKSGFVYAPNAISANGDNINDFFYLIADEQALVELLQIYDRWGELLFETKNILPNKPELGWNGSFNDEKMNPGVYVYYAKVKLGDGKEQILKGDFTLIR